MTIPLILLYGVLIATICLVIINTNSTSKTLAYLFLIFTFPIVGVIVYFTVGVNYRKQKLYSKKIKIDSEAFPQMNHQLKEFANTVYHNNVEKLLHFNKLASYQRPDFTLTPNNKIELLIGGENKFPEVLTALKNAKKHIHIEYYIYEDDAIGQAVADLLIEKAKEGVEVRFIYDDFGSRGVRKSLVKRMKASGVETYPFFKIMWVLFANRINYRNHRKIIIIDGETGFVGGINVSDKYINDGKEKLFWRDTHMKIQGLAVLNLQNIFLTDWNFCSGQNITFNEDYFPLSVANKFNEGDLVQIISSGPDSEHPNIMYSMLQAIMLARKEILITTPYFVPNESFMDALKIAALSGVEIKLLVPGISDSFIVNSISNSNYMELLSVGTEIYKYNKGFVHAKTMVCDEFVSFVGTANLDHRSFDLNFEVNAAVYDAEFARKLKGSFLEDLQYAEKIDPQEWKNRPKPIQFFERLVRLLSPLT